MQSFMDSALQTAEDMRKHLTEKVSQDSEFRQKMISDPRSAIQDEFGVDIPENIDVKVHESDLNTLHFVLPFAPDLDEEQLEAIAAGCCCCWG